MALKIGRLGILVALIAVVLLAVVLLGLSYVEVGATGEIGARVMTLRAPDLVAIPQEVQAEAARLAEGKFSGRQRDDFVEQLLSSYMEARDKDVVILFNPGGWGQATAERTPGWRSILLGIKAQLDEMGYSSLALDYRRTTESVRGRIKEAVEISANYPFKAKDLACRVRFLMDHVPGLKVIIAGESNGAVITASVMDILRDDPKVYSIQTGPPPWERHSVRGRTLVLRNNGLTRDSYSDADILAMLWSNIKALFGGASPEGEGTLLRYLKAPGHDYFWQYPNVSGQIMKFLEDNLGVKRS